VIEHMIPYGHQSIGEDDIAAVVDVLRSDWLTQGPKVEEFERALADYSGAKHAVVFANGTAALQAAYYAAGFVEGDEFITSPMTFAATANAGIWQGGKPVFVDVEQATGNIDANLIEAALTEKTKAIVPIDYAGNPADLENIKRLAKDKGLIVIEDACHALGAVCKGIKLGTLSDMTVFSFHPVKPITTGEGGAVATDNEDFADKLRTFRTHGITKQKLVHESEGAWYYEMQDLGQNYRLTDMQCALGLSQLKKLDGFIQRRREAAARYHEALSGVAELILPTESERCVSGWHLYPIRVSDTDARRRVFDGMRAAGIGVQVHYIPVHFHPYYEKMGYSRGLCPEAEKFYAGEISLPIFPGLTHEDQDFVIAILIGLMRKN